MEPKEVRPSRNGGPYAPRTISNIIHLSRKAKHPVILPKDHHFSELIMHHYHMISGHSGLRAINIQIQIQIPIPSLMLSNDVFLEEENLCWWGPTMAEILWKPRRSYEKLFATGIKARFMTSFWQETSSGFSILLPGHIMGTFGSDTFVLCRRSWKLSLYLRFLALNRLDVDIIRSPK